MNKEVLLTDEIRSGMMMTKFPGGGLEKGEGLIDCLKREFREELEIEIKHCRHYYTTDFYQKSYFDDSQVISVYYLIESDELGSISISEKALDFKGSDQMFRWLSPDMIEENDLTFPIDRKVLNMLKGQ